MIERLMAAFQCRVDLSRRQSPEPASLTLSLPWISVWTRSVLGRPSMPAIASAAFSSSFDTIVCFIFAQLENAKILQLGEMEWPSWKESPRGADGRFG
jgi:hypothetical protein